MVGEGGGSMGCFATKLLCNRVIVMPVAKRPYSFCDRGYIWPVAKQHELCDHLNYPRSSQKGQPLELRLRCQSL